MKLNRYHALKIVGITLRFIGGIWLILWMLKKGISWVVPPSLRPSGLHWYFALPDIPLSLSEANFTTCWPFILGVLVMASGITLATWATWKLKNYQSL